MAVNAPVSRRGNRQGTLAPVVSGSYLMTLYSTTNQDVTTLVRRYLDAGTLADRNNTMKALEKAAREA